MVKKKLMDFRGRIGARSAYQAISRVKQITGSSPVMTKKQPTPVTPTKVGVQLSGHQSASSVDIFRDCGWLRNRQTIRLKAFDVKTNGVADLLLDGADRRSRRDAAGKIGDIGGVIGIGLFDDNRVAHI